MTFSTLSIKVFLLLCLSLKPEVEYSVLCVVNGKAIILPNAVPVNANSKLHDKDVLAVDNTGVMISLISPGFYGLIDGKVAETNSEGKLVISVGKALERLKAIKHKGNDKVNNTSYTDIQKYFAASETTKTTSTYKPNNFLVIGDGHYTINYKPFKSAANKGYYLNFEYGGLSYNAKLPSDSVSDLIITDTSFKINKSEYVPVDKVANVKLQFYDKARTNPNILITEFKPVFIEPETLKNIISAVLQYHPGIKKNVLLDEYIRPFFLKFYGNADCENIDDWLQKNYPEIIK